MILSVISDLHVDVNGYEDVLNGMIKVLKIRKSNSVLIAGDISDDHSTTLSFIKDLKTKANINVYWVAGNHDLWSKNKYDINIQEIKDLYKSDDGFLCGSKDILDNWKLIGDTGWYDYSLADFKFSYDEMEKMSYKERTWQDSINLKMSWCNAKEHDMQIWKLRQELSKFEDKSCIFMTHMISHKNFTVKNSKDSMWDYFNGFLGSESLCDLALNKNIKYVICGHVHHRKRFVENSKEYLCCCLGTKNEFEFYKNLDLDWNIANAMEDIFIM